MNEINNIVLTNVTAHTNQPQRKMQEKEIEFPNSFILPSFAKSYHSLSIITGYDQHDHYCVWSHFPDCHMSTFLSFKVMLVETCM